MTKEEREYFDFLVDKLNETMTLIHPTCSFDMNKEIKEKSPTQIIFYLLDCLNNSDIYLRYIRFSSEASARENLELIKIIQQMSGKEDG